MLFRIITKHDTKEDEAIVATRRPFYTREAANAYMSTLNSKWEPRVLEDRQPRIRFVVYLVHRYADVNGNTYHHAVIYSTMTGRSIVIDDYGCNAEHHVRNAFYEATGERLYWPEVITTDEWLKPREYDARKKFHGDKMHGHLNQEHTRQLIRELEEISGC